uniref:Uncharacterized protein n=1 Tax=Chromera velia CCMP2878 TaxID=1169474 RepID=A0A0G4F2X8_9ALVE|eukprot:Cvel_2683.t1-p1 / transcript=Cvel_2683.t1 / gene=Cvel_2683 / organism=Chromera_velia_CCMP2878 / gene_product=hypothetical protein / transcript_product=hypothetical protein / location=Cvel_scaffold107:84804-85136(+) / protein_length=111 / sequence_SO=supercontig / SO=protein_coding / is_pseudo=false
MTRLVCVSLALLAAPALGAADMFKNLDGLLKNGDLFKLPDYSTLKSKTQKNKDLPTCETANIDCTGLGARMNWLACIPEGYKVTPGGRDGGPGGVHADFLLRCGYLRLFDS